MYNREDSLAKTSKDLILKEPFYGFLLIMLNKIWNGKVVPTAGVSKNGINYQLAINPEFWENLTENHRLGILKHELLHIAFQHLTAYHSYSNRELANVAMDMEINQYIERGWLPGDEYTKEEFENLKTSVTEAVKKGLEDKTMTEDDARAELKKIPMRGVMIEDYPELDLDLKAGTRYYYDKLLKAQDDKDKNGTSGSQAMDDLLDQIEEGQNPADHPTWGEFENMSEAEKKLIEKQVDTLLRNAVEMTQKKRGIVPGELSAYILEMDKVEKPKFDWRSYIRRFTGVSSKVFTKKLRRKDNKRYSDNPGLKIKMRQHMLLAIDTSGSVSDDELKEFMNEIHHIHKAGVDITIIQCDAAIQSIKSYTGKFGGIEFGGRGGTEFDPVLEYYNENLRKYTSLVYFTDGECYTSVKPKAPVLWVLSERSHMNEDLPGKVIKLEL
jgi:predicted metal-dependent peptidase